MKYLLILLTVFFALMACKTDNSKKIKNDNNANLKPDSSGVVQGNSMAQYTGKPGQLVLVAENTVLTEEIMTLLDSVFGEYIRPYYPPEKKFEIFTRSPEQFESGSHHLRNLMFLEINNEIPKGDPRMILKKDYFARTQLIAEFKANNINDLYALMMVKLPELYELFDKQEWKREYLRHKSEKNNVAKELLRKQFGIELDLPRSVRYESRDSKFAHILFPDRSRQMELEAGGAYLSSKANFIQSGIMVWQFDFKDSSQLNPAYLMQARDTILKYYAKHEIDGVYMGTQDHPAVLPIHNRIQIGDAQGYEFRGLYKFTGRLEPSGGKFWSFHFLHPTRKKVIAVSGYLDAPPTMSASYDLRKIQAVLYSLKIIK
ncbi:MAG: DUF4837 family protein [Brumimicrobium sp.]|nr:DUF4837 family protein [Brumimicrobium sp.]